MSVLNYEELGPISHADAERVFSSGDSEQIARALVALSLHDKDWKWIQEQCLRFLGDRREVVVSAAILALGHTARINRTLDRASVVDALEGLAADARYSGKVQDTLDDVAIFVKKRRNARAKSTGARKKVKSQARQVQSDTRKNGAARKKTATPSVSR